MFMLGLALLTAVLATPTPDQLMGGRMTLCPDGSLMAMTFYDQDGDGKPDVVTFDREKGTVATLHVKEDLVVIGQRVAPLAEVQKVYETPCDIPLPVAS